MKENFKETLNTKFQKKILVIQRRIMEQIVASPAKYGGL
jgi:hypothetical protein